MASPPSPNVLLVAGSRRQRCSSLKSRGSLASPPTRVQNLTPRTKSAGFLRILRMFSTGVSRFSTRSSCSASPFSTKPSCSARFPISPTTSRARVCLRFSTRRRQLPIASHPRKPLRSYAYPPGLRYPHATHSTFQSPSITGILLVLVKGTWPSFHVTRRASPSHRPKATLSASFVTGRESPVHGLANCGRPTVSGGAAAKAGGTCRALPG